MAYGEQQGESPEADTHDRIDDDHVCEQVIGVCRIESCMTSFR